MNTIRIRVYKAKTLSSWSAFRNQETGREYSRLWPKKYAYPTQLGKQTVLNEGAFSAEWCEDAKYAIHAENSRLLRETGVCGWTSGDYVSMPSKYYVK
jgi:hypothetical protein